MDVRKYIIGAVIILMLVLGIIGVGFFSCKLCANKEKAQCQADNAIIALESENRKSDIINQMKQKSVSERRKTLEKYIIHEN